MKKKFTVIDIIIVVFLLAVIAFGFIKFGHGLSWGANTQKIKFTVLARKVDAGVGDIVNAGDEVTISLKEKAYATVLGVSETEHTEVEFNPNQQKYISQVVEGKADIFIDLECDANVSDTEILDNDAPIRVGNEAYVRGKGYAFEGYIVKIDDTNVSEEK